MCWVVPADPDCQSAAPLGPSRAEVSTEQSLQNTLDTWAPNLVWLQVPAPAVLRPDLV